MRVTTVVAIASLVIISSCGLNPRDNDSEHDSLLNAYDQLQKNPVDRGIVPAQLFKANREINDIQCEAKAAQTTVITAGKNISFLADGPGSRSADWSGLNSILDPIASRYALKMTVINIVRVNGKPHFHYLSNETQNDAVETWSSSKPLAIAAMASQLRQETNGKIGIDGQTLNTNGDGGYLPIGDLVSIATVYRERVHPYNSNNIGTWAQNVSGRSHSTKLINTWLSRPGESLGGGYGDDSSGLSNAFIGANGESYKTRLSSHGSSSNMLSTLSFADFYRRIILHRELAAQDQAEGRELCDPENMDSLSLPCVSWSDMKTILYGASPNKTRYFKDRAVGGMAGGMSTILHHAITQGQPERLNALYNGRWRIFTKVGWGEINDLPDTRWHGYACLPAFHPSSGASTVGGKEFMISVALKPMPGLTTAKADIILQKAVSAVTTKLLNGTLN